MKSKVLAVIPARGGSKSIKLKNVRDVCGKPLLYYQVKNALDAKLVDTVVLATDSDVIAATVKNIFGELVRVVMRPPEISHDLSKTEETLAYVLNELGKDDYGVIVTLEPTNPLNRPEYVDDCIRLLIEDNYDSACCVTDDYGFFLDTPEERELLIERPMHQNIRPRTRETGNCWATKVTLLLEERNRLGGKIGTVKIAEADACHLDGETDWRIAEALLRARASAETGNYFKVKTTVDTETNYEEAYWGRVIDPDGVERDRSQERDKRIRECAEEISYINAFTPGRILDVGCGLGFLLSGIDDKWEKHGVEISSFAAKEAQKIGTIFCGTLERAAYEADSFDAVVLYHVIEHMEDPVKQLQEVRRILKPFGKLIVGTPDFECGIAKRFGDNFRLLHDKTHRSLFTTTGLLRLLEDLFFEVERVSYPFFDTEHFTEANLLRLFDTDKISPPFYGNIFTCYAYKK